ncbi:DNA-binding IclR family transcriptional regulator [Sphingomonas sp. UYEF23]
MARFIRHAEWGSMASQQIGMGYMATADRVLSILGLFTIEHPEWTVEAIATELGLSSSTVYQYVGSLVQADLLIAGAAAKYMIGPAVIALDRVTRRFDPLIHAADEPLRSLICSVDCKAIGLLCRVYRLKVMCVDQAMSRPLGLETSYERGRLMPFTRGGGVQDHLGEHATSAATSLL